MKLLIAGLFVIASSSALAETISLDFKLALENYQTQTLISEKGFNLTAPGPFGFTAFSVTEAEGNHYLAKNFNTQTGEIKLKKIEGGAFDLISIDLANYGGGNPIPVSVTFNGLKSDGSFFMQTFTDISSPFSTQIFSGFLNLTELAWDIGDQLQDLLNFDNIVIGMPSEQVSEVPVPAAAWLFGSALIGFAGLRRKTIL